MPKCGRTTTVAFGRRATLGGVVGALVGGSLGLAVLWVAASCLGSLASAQAFTPDDLRVRTLRRRAVEAAIWGVPVVGFDSMFQAMVRDARGRANQIVYWSQPADWKKQTLTTDTDAIEVMAFINTRTAGPMVLEIPPADRGAIAGTVMDCWQVALEDVGLAGVDKGEGGKFLILPPEYGGQPPAGYIVLPSDHYANFALLRSTPWSRYGRDIAKAVTYAKRIRLYPLSAAARPPQTTFIDAKDVVFDALVPYDLRFFESLDRMVQAEPWMERDRALIGTLASIGIEKGRPFKPDAKTADILTSAVQEAHAWIESRHDSMFAPYYPGGRWFVPADDSLQQAVVSGFKDADSYPIDARATVFTFAIGSVRHPGIGALRLFATRDRGGRPLDGAKSYRLTLPPNVPALQSWSATAYDHATHALIRDVDWGSRSSFTEGLQTNDDGTTDIWFGPSAPEGRESNWVPTRISGDFEVVVRFGDPQKALLDKTWTLPDLVESAALPRATTSPAPARPGS